jgi:PAS domain S-box-containing protein
LSTEVAVSQRADVDPAGPLVGGSWLVRLFLFLGIAAVMMTPITFAMPNPDRFGGLAEGGMSAVGFFVAARLADRGHRRGALAAAALTLLVVALVGAATLNAFAPGVLGIAVVAAVLILPATPPRMVVPTVVVVGIVASIAIVIAELSQARVEHGTSPPIDSIVTSISVLALTLGIVAWTHHRLVAAIDEGSRIRSDLDASEGRYRMLVETAPDGILIVDPITLQARAANRRAAELFGFASSEELLAAGPGPVLPDLQPDGRKTLDVAHALIDATLAGEQVVAEMVYRRKDGTLFTAEVRPTLAESPGPTDVRLSLTNVSDRVAAVRARDLIEARFRSLFAASPNAVLVFDSAGRILDASDRAVEIFGYPISTLRSLVVEDLVPPAERERHHGMRQELQGSRVQHVSVAPREVSAVRADGSIIPVEVGLSWFETSEGWFATAVVVDVSAQRASERAVKDAAETIRAVFDASPAGIVVTGLDGRIRLWNEAMARLTGISPTNAIGAIDPSVPVDRVASRAAIREAVGQNRTVTGADLVLARSDGSSFPAVGSFGPLHDATGTVVGVVSVVEDVTAMRSLEAQVNRKARLEAIGQLAGGIAHDINNVLTAIGGFASLSLDDLDAGLPVDREAIATIAEGAARTSALTRQLLAFARRDIRPAETLVLAESVRAVEPMLRGLIGEHITLAIETTGEGHVRIASSQVEQLIINLVVNARDAMPTGGTIRVGVETIAIVDDSIGGRVGVEAGSYVALTVTDDGTGMSPEVVERAFDPFFTTKGPDEGTGLGLSTVHGIVTEAGGHVWIESEVDSGTTFRIVLPEVHPAVHETGGAADIVDRGHETILLVEDEDVVRTLGIRVLERAGFRVLAAADAADAFSIAAGHEGPIDLLLTDVVMPRVLGPELARQLSLLRPGLRVLFTSGYTATGAGLTSSLPPDARFIDKPFSPSGLVSAVRAALDAAPPRVAA